MAARLALLAADVRADRVSRVEDLEVVARIVKGKKRARQTRVIVTPASPRVLRDALDVAICPVVGPEVVMGSTRMKSGTAQKLERGLPAGKAIFDVVPFTVVSLDWIKSDRNRELRSKLRTGLKAIRQAIESLFGVKVTGVWTSQQRGKPRRLGNKAGLRPRWKKAIVTLRAGDTIEIFEG